MARVSQPLPGVLAGEIEPDSGEVAARKRTRLSYVAQQSEFTAGVTIRTVLESALKRVAVPPTEWEGRIAETLGRAGFDDLAADASRLSGGWRKRLAIAEALVQQPDVLSFGRAHQTAWTPKGSNGWKALLNTSSFACIVVGHDRYFLENVGTETVELNCAYPDGLLRVKGNYSTFLVKKEAFLEAQAKQQDALANRVRTEKLNVVLRRGPKARTTKSKARIDRANELIGELAEVFRAATGPRPPPIEFFCHGTCDLKRLVELENLELWLRRTHAFRRPQLYAHRRKMRVGSTRPLARRSKSTRRRAPAKYGVLK